MTAAEVIANVRDDLSEPQTTGFFTDTLLLDYLNRIARSKLIRKLWRVGRFYYLGGLMSRQTSLTLTEGTDDNYYYAISSLTYTAFKQSVTVFVDNDPTVFLAYDSYYAKRDTDLGSYEATEIGYFSGDRLWVYNPDSTTFSIDYVKIPDAYVTTDTLDFDDDIIEDVLTPMICEKAERRDRGIVMGSTFRGDYTDALTDLEVEALRNMKKLEQTPRTSGYWNVTRWGKSIYGGGNRTRTT